MDVANRRITRNLPPGVLTELRVHGVGGATPESVLDVPYTDFVAGDPTAGFFARPLELPVSGPVRRVEAYSWGGLTSRSRLRALWLLLLPFALINQGGWMMAQSRGTGGTAVSRTPIEWLAAGGVRVYGLVATVAAALYASVAALDLYAYQCGVEACAGGRTLLWPVANEWSSQALGRQLAVASLIPIGVVGLLAYLTKRSQDWVHPDVDQEPVHLDPAGRLGFTDRGFWTAKHVAHRLGITHTAVAFATVGYVLSSIVAARPDAGFGAAYQVTFALLMGAGAALVMLLGRLPKQWYWGLLVVSGATLFGLLWATLTVPGGPRVGQAPGARSLGSSLGVVAVAILLFLAVVQAVAVRRGPTFRSRLYNWFAPLALHTIGLGLVLVIGSGALIQVANLLGDGMSQSTWATTAEPGSEWPVIYSDAIGAVAVNTIFVLVAAAVAALLVLAYRWFKRDALDDLADEYGQPDVLGDRLVRRIVQRVSTARVVAGMTDYAGAVLVTGVVTLLLAFGLAAALAADQERDILTDLHEPAANLVGLMVLGALILIGRTTRSEGLRRGIGIVWDVVTFWPRWFHPWAPPSYGERAVPQLAHRLRTLTKDGCVIVSAHSQGSLVAVAAIAKLAAEDGVAPRTALITHGSPLQRLYGRYFRRHVDETLLQDVGDLLTTDGGWVNLHRRTDFIGGPIVREGPSAIDDQLLLDPPTLELEVGGPIPKPAKHFGYFDDPAHDHAIEALAEALGCATDPGGPRG